MRCAQCGTLFKRKRSGLGCRKLYCSPRCRRAMAKWRKQNPEQKEAA